MFAAFGGPFFMYRKVGMLFCTNAMLAGVASSFVFAQKDVDVEDAKKLASGEDLVSGNIGDFEANKKDIKQIDKKIVLVYSLVALGILSLVVGVAIVVRLRYLKNVKNKRIKAVDEAWSKAGFGGKLTFSLFGKHFDEKYMKLFDGTDEKLREGATYLYQVLCEGCLADFEFIFASKAKKVYKKILKNPKLVDGKGMAIDTMIIKNVAKKEGWHNDWLELERFGFFFRCLYFGLLNKKSENMVAFNRLQTFLKKLYELEHRDVVCEFMGFELRKSDKGIFHIVLRANSLGNVEILGKDPFCSMSCAQKMTGGAFSKEQFENLFGVKRKANSQ